MYPKLQNEVTFGKSWIYDPSVPYFGLLDDQYRSAHPPGTCKEYLLDYMSTAVRRQGGGIYNASTAPACVDELRVLVGAMGDRIDASVELLHSLEDLLGIAHSVVNVLPNMPDVFVFTGSPRWIIAPPMLSLYSLTIRSGRIHHRGDRFDVAYRQFAACPNSGDAHFWNQARPAVDVILAFGDREVFGSDVKANWSSLSFVHTSGIAEMGMGNLRLCKPEWYRFIPEKRNVAA